MRSLSFCFGSFLLFAAVGDAQEQDERLFNRLSNATLESIFADAKVPFVLKSTDINGKAVYFYEVSVARQKVFVINHGGALSFWSQFRRQNGDPISLETVNRWNMTNRARAFVDDRGSAILKNELEMYDGTTRKIVNGFVGQFFAGLGSFAEFTK